MKYPPMRQGNFLTHRIFFAFVIFGLFGCASTGTVGGNGPKAGEDYTGADAGVLIYAVGTVRGFGMRFRFPYSLTQSSDREALGNWKGYIRPRVGGAIYLKIIDPDFEGYETGHVVSRKLPPGRYTISDFEFFGSGPDGSYEWKPQAPFSINFTIEQGTATYVGSFMRSLAPPGDPSGIGPAGYFLVADRAERDLPIAMSRLPAGMTVLEQVTDVDQFGSKVLRSKSLEPMDAVP
jgi:hypothetical protein